MTVGELKKGLKTMNLDEREAILVKLAKMLTPVSIKTLMVFQQKWMDEHPAVNGKPPPFEEFCKAQNVEIATCLLMEQSSPVGEMVRGQFKLLPLTDETVIQ